MKNFLSGLTIAFVGLNLGLPAFAQFGETEQMEQQEALDSPTQQSIICDYRYKIGEVGWERESASGTTRLEAKNARGQRIDRLEEEAAEEGEDLEVVYTQCRDPYR
ncbi:hypothetical protein ACL6C3_02625 [Capilliphycus salinus ALCB114379]|uniref:hypothetical protein n=1 Tax=Capilliphycus salinus TaxID=2768948 RepID=UPI0039A58A83